jgi:hypothetical protein
MLVRALQSGELHLKLTAAEQLVWLDSGLVILVPEIPTSVSARCGQVCLVEKGWGVVVYLASILAVCPSYPHVYPCSIFGLHLCHQVSVLS